MCCVWVGVYDIKPKGLCGRKRTDMTRRPVHTYLWSGCRFGVGVVVSGYRICGMESAVWCGCGVWMPTKWHHTDVSNRTDEKFPMCNRIKLGRPFFFLQ